MSGFKMDDYVPVNERVDEFYKAFPNGSIQSEIVELTDTRVTVKAFAYRTPDDPRPGIGHSSLGIPGATSFTKGSEIENAETSAWGRAIAALGFEVRRGIASAEEVRNKPQRTSQPASPRARLAEVASAHNITADELERYAKQVGASKPATDEQIEQIIALIEQPGSGVPTASPATDTRDEREPVHASAASATTPARQPEAVDSPPATPAADLTVEDILEATGGELLPKVDPEIQARIERANARAKGAPKNARETHEASEVPAA